jgi:hypothetical protein
MISMDAIHAQAKERRKFDNARIIATPIVDDCLWTKHAN